MTTMRIALGLAALIMVGMPQARSAPAPPVSEPQYINSFFAADAEGKLIELERKIVAFHTKIKVLLPGYASVKWTTEFKPGRSPVRLAATMQYIVRGRTPMGPLSQFELRALKAAKDHREFVMTQAHGSIISGSAAPVGVVPIRFEEYGASSYRITPDKPLEPGEYAFMVRGLGTELYCFGVDPER